MLWSIASGSIELADEPPASTCTSLMADLAPPLELAVSHSHLFRGIQLRARLAEVTFPLRASIVDLIFSDGVELEAELVEQGDTALTLAVPAYETATGHHVAAAMWPISDVTTDDETLMIKLGLRLR